MDPSKQCGFFAGMNRDSSQEGSMGGSLVALIISAEAEVRDRSLFEVCREMDRETLLVECEKLERFWKQTDNLYDRVRALFFLHGIHRYVLPQGDGSALCFGPIPFQAYQHLLSRRFHEAITSFLKAGGSETRLNDTLRSGLAQSYAQLGLQNLADQVRRCVRGVVGNQWMFRNGHPLDYPLVLRRELLEQGRQHSADPFPLLIERTAVRMDLSHSSWSDIFFLGMDRPEFAKVINISIDLCLKDAVGGPRPPVQAFFRVIDEPVIRLVSIDLECQAVLTSFHDVFDFGRDYLGLLKAALIASGMVPPGMEGCEEPLSALLDRLVGPGLGFELVSSVDNIPKGSRLAVSTNLLAALIAVCMRASGQVANLTGGLSEPERRLVAARAILGEWLGGSGGGWQDSGGVWPGIKLIEGCLAQEGDREFGMSRGCLLPRHKVMDESEVPAGARKRLQDSLILVHGGLAQNVGPILEMVTERYLLRTSEAWDARKESLAITYEILEALRAGDIRRLGGLTTRHFHGPLKTIIPWASNAYTESVISQVRGELGEGFWGFWMLGGMSGGGMGFMVDPELRDHSKEVIHRILLANKRAMAFSLPFAMDPVVYDFAINDDGSKASWGDTFPSGYYRLRLPRLLRIPPGDRSVGDRADLETVARGVKEDPSKHAIALDMLSGLLPEGTTPIAGGGGNTLQSMLEAHGFDSVQHEGIRHDLLTGKIGVAQNRMRSSSRIEDVEDADLVSGSPEPEWLGQAKQYLREGRVAVVSLAAGAGSRWTQGAGVVKALHPFCVMGGRHRNFLEVHLAKCRRTERDYGCRPCHALTTSYLTHRPVLEWMSRTGWEQGRGGVYLSEGKSVGLRLVPTITDLRFAWEELPQQQLDEQAEKVRRSVRKALMGWAKAQGEASDYRDNLPLQCMHPVGHWYEIPNMLLNGTLSSMIELRPQLDYLMIHNIDTLGASLEPAMLASFLASGCDLMFEVISRRIEDHGGGLARVDGRVRLVEGMALPSELDEFKLRFYNTATTWVGIDAMLRAFGICRNDLADMEKVRLAVRGFASRMPTYVTLKDVKKRWGRGHEDVYPVLQFERLWGDMSAVPELKSAFLHVSRHRGQQLKEQSQLDAWVRDGSRDEVESLCEWDLT